MEIIDVDFTVEDAQKIAYTSKQKKEFVFYKFHHAIVKKIKQRAEHRFFNLEYNVPTYLFGQQMYNCDDVIFWLTERLKKDGFYVLPDYYARRLYISWKPDPEITNVPKGRSKKRTTSTRHKKNVTFNLDKNLYMNY